MALVHSAHVLLEETTEKTLSELNSTLSDVLEILGVVMGVWEVLVGFVVGVVWLHLLKEWGSWVSL